METAPKSIGSPSVVQCVRLFAAVLLTPIVVVIWLGISLHMVMAHFGANPSDTASLILGMFLLVVGFGLPFGFMLLIGLPYAIGMLIAGRLNLLTVLVPALPAAIIYGLIVYFSLQPERHAAPARAMAIAAVAGVLVASLCFYVVGAWRNTPGAATTPKKDVSVLA